MDLPPPPSLMGGIGQPLPPSLGGIGLPPPPSLPTAPTLAPPTASMVARSNERAKLRLYVKGDFSTSTDLEVMGFFNTMLCKALAFKGEKPMSGNSCPVVEVNMRPTFCFLTFTHVEDSRRAMGLDGVRWKGQHLRLKRPNTYTGPIEEVVPLTIPGQISNIVRNGANKLFVGQIPITMGRKEVADLLQSVGELKSFNLCREASGESKGYAFCEYLDPTNTEAAVLSLNGRPVGDKTLVVQVSANDPKDIAGGGSEAAPVAILLPLELQPSPKSLAPPSKVVKFLNVADPFMLLDPDVYADTMEDIIDACWSFGPLESIAIPRPRKLDEEESEFFTTVDHLGQRRNDPHWTEPRRMDIQIPPSCGCAYALFNDQAAATACQESLAGRSYNTRQLLTGFYPEDKFRAGDLQ